MQRLLIWLLPLLLLIADTRPAGAATISILDYGACSGCGSTANRLAIQAAIDAAASGDTLYIPNGTYTFNQAGANFYGLRISKPLTVLGESRDGATLAVDAAEADDADSLFGIYIDNTQDVTFRNVGLDGNKPDKDTVTFYVGAVEQHPGLFFDTIDNITIDNVYIRNFTGDGMKFYDGCTDILVTSSLFQYNQRNGLTLSPNIPTPIDRVRITANTFQFNTVQPIDNEHGPVLNAEIDNNTMTSALGDYVVAMGGLDEQADPAANWYSDTWDVHHNTLNGGVTVVMGRNFLLRDNVIYNPTTKPNAEIRLSSENVTIQDNDMIMLNPVDPSNAPVMIAGSVSAAQAWTPSTAIAINQYRANDGRVYRTIIAGTTDVAGGPTGTGADIVDGTVHWAYVRDGVVAQDLRSVNTVVRRNRIYVDHDQAFGVRVEGFVSATIEDNEIFNTVTGFQLNNSGISIRSTSIYLPVESAVIRRNRIHDFGHKGVYVQGNSTARFIYADISDNYVYNTPLGGAMTVGIDLDDGTKTLESVRIGGNIYGCGITSKMTDVPVSASVTSTSPFSVSSPCP